MPFALCCPLCRLCPCPCPAGASDRLRAVLCLLRGCVFILRPAGCAAVRWGAFGCAVPPPVLRCCAGVYFLSELLPQQVAIKKRKAPLRKALRVCRVFTSAIRSSKRASVCQLSDIVQQSAALRSYIVQPTARHHAPAVLPSSARLPVIVRHAVNQSAADCNLIADKLLMICCMGELRPAI